jgi:ubiquitin carboxyl-terminal hydrolase 1
MSTWQQQDAQEYYSKILDQLDREAEQSLRIADSLKYGLKDGPDAARIVKRVTRESDTLRNPLEGMLAQRVGCTRCGYSEGLSLIPFNCLTVPLGNAYLYDVRDCLDEYTKLEQIEGVECPKCTLLRAQTQLQAMSAKQLPEELLHSVQDRLRLVEEALADDDFSDNTIIKKCQVPKKQWVSSTKSKQAVIARPPKCLAVHFNRSLFNEMTGAQTKNNASVQFALGLDLDSWCLGAAEDWSMDPKKSMLPDDELDMDISTCKYELRAVVTHSGRHENGHYICYRKRLHAVSQPSNGDVEDDNVQLGVEEDTKGSEAWFRLSDEDVNITSVDNVLRQSGVFMLFYERIDILANGVKDEKPSSEEAIQICTAPAMVETSEAVQASESGEEYNDVDKFTELVELMPPTDLLHDSLDESIGLETQAVDAEVIENPWIPQSPADPVDSSDADDSSVTSLPEADVGVQPDITPSNRIRMRTSGLGSNSSPDDPLRSPGVRMLAI